jgi:hypothetical protein
MSVANHRCAFRALVGGVQIVQGQTFEAGTLGLVLTSDGTDRWALTCWHVLARPGVGVVDGDPVFQPDQHTTAIGLADAERTDRLLDCAAVRTSLPAMDSVLGLGCVTAHRAPVAGMRVVKSGWMTGITEGRVRSVAGDVVTIERATDFPDDYQLSEAGDSGAIWLEAATLAPVALHLSASAVGEHLALAREFGSVLAALGLHQI